jgi:uncharacterized protein YwqG
MDWGAFVFAAAFMALVVGATQWRELRALYRWWQERPQRAARKAEAAQSLQSFREQFAAANPEGPPMTPEERAELDAWAAAQARPAARLTPTPGPAEPDGCRIGGPVWLAEGQAWPLSASGRRMVFLAQIDFAALPPLPGFPESGVVQVFLPVDDDLMGMGIDDPGDRDVVVLARANGAGAVRHANPPETADDCSPFLRGPAREEGIPLASSPFTAALPREHWEVAARLEGNYRRPGFAEWEDALVDQDDAAPLAHHVGGYPVFVQSDFRQAGHYDDYDTCLLRLTSDKHLQWGDVGEANLLIRAEDLASGHFSRVIFWWDCS